MSHSVGTTTTSLARANKEAILHALAATGPMSRRDLSSNTGMSPATIGRLVSALITAGLVMEREQRSGTVGRPSLIVDLNPRAAVVLSVLVGANSMRVGFCDLRAKVFDTATIAIERVGQPTPVEAVIECIRSFLRSAEAKGLRCVGVGVCVPGTVDEHQNVDYAPALGWRDLALGELLSREINVPSRVENDANALALAEYHARPERSAECLVALVLEEGLGAGIVLNGQLVRGSHGAAGEVGYMLMGRSALIRVFPGFGDLEQRVGTAGVTALGRSAGFVTGDDKLAILDVLSLGREGHPKASEVAAEVLDYLALAIGNICAVLDPALITVGIHEPRLAAWMADELRHRLVGRIPKIPTIACPAAGQNALLAGVGLQGFAAAGSIVDLAESSR